LKQVQLDIQKVLRLHKTLEIKDGSDLITLIRQLNNHEICPFFLVSSVKGTGLDLVRKFLNAVPPRNEWEFLKHKPVEVLIDKTYYVPDVGTVVAGTVMSGKVETGSDMLLGPDGQGNFIPVTITSLHNKRVPVHQVVAGEHVAFSLKDIQRSLTRKGMVLLGPEEKPIATWTFEAVCVISNSDRLKQGFEVVIQCRTVRQTARVEWIGERTLRASATGDDATARFKFLFRPEYLLVGMRVIFRGCCKGIGTITQVNLDEKAGQESRLPVIIEPEPLPPFDASLEPEETFQMDD